jgi:Tfp pilus assembly protein PilX
MSTKRWQHLRPEREDGIALVLAVVVTTVITIMAIAMLSYTSASSRDASLKQSGQSAYSLAEAGVNQALAQLASHYYTTSGTANNASTVWSASWFTGTTSQKSSTDATACTATSTCMAWSASYTSAPAGIKQGTVVVTGTGTVPNPTGASPLRRTVTTRVDVNRPPQLQQTPDYWKEIYTGTPPSPGTVCNLDLGQGVTITAPLYVGGNLCLSNTAQISGSNVTLKVFGWAYVKSPQSTIGASNNNPARIASAQIKGGCASKNDPQPTQTSGCTINRSGGNWAIWDNTPSSSHAPTAPTADPLPAVNWSQAQSDQYNSPTLPSCTNGRSLDEATFNLTPAASYTCTTAAGSINWNYSASTLAVSGNIYFPHNLFINTNNILVKYTGIGSFFVVGSITTANNSFLCVKTASGDCDFANATNSGSSGYWDATQNLLLLQAQGVVSGTNFHFQGGIYSVTSINFGGGQGTTQGPLVSPSTIVVGQQLNGSFPSFPQIQSGSLGTQPPPFNLGSQYGGTY